MTTTETAIESSKYDRRLDDKEMGDLISSVGNHANKLVLLAAMKPGEIYGYGGASSAVNLLRQSQQGAESEGWVPEHTTAFKYFVNSLAPIGMVAKEYIDEERATIGYMLTQKGEDIGVALAGHLLTFAENHNLALSQIFGDTTSRNPDARAGSLRWQLLQGLATQPQETKTSVTELAESVGVDARRSVNNLAELSLTGLVNYEKAQERPHQLHRVDLNKLRDRMLITHGTKTLRVANYILEKHTEDDQFARYDVATIASDLSRDNEKENTPAFRADIRSVLKNWEKVGVLERELEDAGDAKVWVDEKQQDMLLELVEIIDDIQRGDSEALAKGKELAREIISNPERVAQLMSHEQQVSVHYHGQVNAKKRGARILEILHRHEDGMSYAQIQAELKVMGDIVSKQGIARVLKDRDDVSISNSSGNVSRVLAHRSS